jgi:hypothetical protein
MTAQEVRRCGLRGLTLLSQDHHAASSEGVEHCLSVTTSDTAGHGASFGLIAAT